MDRNRPTPLILACLLVLISSLLPASPLSGGIYLDSAHGNSESGVRRSAGGAADFPDYPAGSCAHCHEQHASIDGLEPEPEAACPSAYALFANNFNTSREQKPYSQSDNFCFYCHAGTGSLQSGGAILNYSYARTFGGYTSSNPSGIFAAFNGGSYHNLYDLWRFSQEKFSSFKQSSNPCCACHEPHTAKRNKANPADPVHTAISRPTDHFNLWGDDENERMNTYAASMGGSYRSPYMYGSTGTFEPNAMGIIHDGSMVPDYNTFCLDCHQYQVPTTNSNSRDPSVPAGYLAAINWGRSGDKHGGRMRMRGVDGSEGWGQILAPYNIAPVPGNYVLSCLDCHEPHGTVIKSWLLRKEINNSVVPVECGPAEGDFCFQGVCLRCHTHEHCGGAQCGGCHYHGQVYTGQGACGGPRWGNAF